MIALLLAHALAAVAAPWLVRLLGRRAFWVLAAVPAATAVWALANTTAAHSATPPTASWTWIPSLKLELSFVLDPLAWLMCLVVGGIGAAILIYCSGYFSDDEPGLGRFAGCLTAFAGAMLGLVGTDDLLVLFVFWEATTVLSYLLIGHKPESKGARSAATEALVVTTFGGLAMLLGIILLGEAAGTYQISEILTSPPSGPVVDAAVVCILVGALSKSAQVPFHFWLPGAMAAPTPVSGYLHAAAMVKAGIYLVARLAPGFADSGVWLPVVLGVGGATMLLGAYRALRQHDLKLLLAYGTVSQLGFLVIVSGTGTRNAGLTALTLLLAHALFKACLFLVVGTIDHSCDTRDLRQLSGLRRRTPLLMWTSILAAMSMAGVPPLLGFVSKEMAYDTAWTAATENGSLLDAAVLAVLFAGSVLTFAYSARFVIGAFFVKPGMADTPVLHPPRGSVLLVPVVLAGLSLLAGPVSEHIERYLVGYAETMPATTSHEVHLGLWHGFSPALGLSLATIALGLGLVAVRGLLERTQQGLQLVPAAEQGYRVVMRSLDRVSLEVTGAVQRGSLPLQLGLIFGTWTVLGLGTVVLGGVDWPDTVTWAVSPAYVGLAVVAMVAAVAASRSRRRLRGVVLVGITGYATALFFVLHGAPDLGLTQVLVETVALVVLVLVLRRFSGRFNDDSTKKQRIVRAAMGIGVGATVTLAGLVAAGARAFPPASEGMAESAYDFGGGYNVVNVILVDIRAWDTMGELSVVLVAATGIASLVYVRGNQVHEHNEKLRLARTRRRQYTRPLTSASSWLAEGEQVPAERRSVVLEVVTRLLFHSVIVFSVYLLLAGHNLPGGGFAAGLMAGLGLTVRYLAGGRAELQAAIPLTPGLLMGTGLFLSAGFGFASILFGGRVLQTWVADVDVPLLGNLHVASSVVFDLGVYLVVVGLVLDILRSLGGHLDVLIEEDRVRAARGRRLGRSTVGATTGWSEREAPRDVQGRVLAKEMEP